MTSAQRGRITAGTWLVGLGVVFLIRQALGLDWSVAWPLFVILVGVASVVSTALNGVRGVSGLWSFTWPIVWIVVGIALLASTTGRLGQTPLDLIAEWWPILLVVLGVWFLIGAVLPFGGGPIERLTVPLGGVGEAAVRIKFGAGELTAGRAAPGNLVDGSFAGGVVRKDLGSGRVELSQDTTFGMPWLDRRSDWVIGLTGEVPLDLRLDTGAARATSATFASGRWISRLAPVRRAFACPAQPARRRFAPRRVPRRWQSRCPTGSRSGSAAGWRSAAARSTSAGSHGARAGSPRRTTRRRRTAPTSTSRVASGRFVSWRPSEWW